MNNRRKIIVALGASAFAASFGSFAQKQGKIWRIGYLGPSDRSASASMSDAFTAKLRELGYVEGKNLVIEWRSADDYERMPGLAADLARLPLDAVVSAGSAAIGALQKASTTIPIVMASASDPVGAGFVKSLAHPGGNITGVSTQTSELGPKRLEMLQSMVPKLSRVAVLVNPTSPGNLMNLENIQSVAQKSPYIAPAR